MLNYDPIKTTEAILEQLNQSGMSDSGFAKKIAISPQAVCGWRSRRSSAGIEQIVRAAGVFGIEPGELLRYEEREISPF